MINSCKHCTQYHFDNNNNNEDHNISADVAAAITMKIDQSVEAEQINPNEIKSRCCSRATHARRKDRSAKITNNNCNNVDTTIAKTLIHTTEDEHQHHHHQHHIHQQQENNNNNHHHLNNKHPPQLITTKDQNNCLLCRSCCVAVCNCSEYLDNNHNCCSQQNENITEKCIKGNHLNTKLHNYHQSNSQNSINQRSALMPQCSCNFTISCSKNTKKYANPKDVVQINNNSNKNSKANDNVQRRWFSTSSTSTTRTLKATTSTCSTLYLVVCSLIMLFAFSPIRGALAGSTAVGPTRDISSTPRGTICQSKDIRNKPSDLQQLKGCRIIEGFLIISLIEFYNVTDYDVSFPDLVEITDYFILYRVNGLKSLLNLFPNLAVIRGNNLLKDYAFVIYEMDHLHEIGLKSLTTIKRGNVRIEKNPILCFVDTIDWLKIATDTTSMEEHFIASNRQANLCPICPSGMKKTDNDNNMDTSDELDCPVSSVDPKKRLCWNRQNCQKVCPLSCENNACTSSGKCCDESCFTCAEDRVDKCEICKYYTYGDKCVKKCPQGYFLHQGRRCITENECRAVSRPFALSIDSITFLYPMIPFNGTCSTSCPINHIAEGESGHRTCTQCQGTCKKECGPGTIDSISAAQNYRECVRITGSLIIQIRSQGGQNVIKELERSLSDVEQIDGHLKIVRSFPIVSLSFFKKLRVIKGTPSASNNERYSLYVMDNQNLQSLFSQNVTIERGKLFFHFNPKLCLLNIERLKEHVYDLRNVSKIPIEDVAPTSNGDKVACNATILNHTLTFLSSNAAVVKVTAMKYDDERVLLGYVLHYIAVPSGNVSLYDGRDACGGDGWKIEDITGFNKSEEKITATMFRLRPYTRYAYFIKTYTIASEPNGGQTEIDYFRTLPDKPDAVQKLVATSFNSHEISVSWEAPKKANGNLTTYIIRAYLKYEDEQILDQRNYCYEPGSIIDAKLPSEIKPPTKVVVDPAQCECKAKKPYDDGCDPDENENCGYYGGPGGGGGERIYDAEAEQIINFEDELHNVIYVKRVKASQVAQSGSRRRRNVALFDDTTLEQPQPRNVENNSITLSKTNAPSRDGIDEDIFPTSQKSPVNEKANAEEKISKKINDEYYEYIYKAVNVSTTSVILKELKHFATYSISVKACREVEKKESDFQNCSNEVLVHERTLKIEYADNIRSFSVDAISNSNSNHSFGTVKISWLPPEKPNGIIVSYTIRYQRVDLEHAKGQDICITHRFYQNISGEYYLKHLENGNYSFAVMATSLSGPGHWSPVSYIMITESKLTTSQIVIIVFAAIVSLILVIAILWIFMKRKFGTPVSDFKLIASVNPEYVSMQYQADEWEVSRDNILQLRELGQGSFGMVYEGMIKVLNDKSEIPCAIKTVNENATDRERINFLKEAGVMKAFDTHHVVRLLGVCSSGQPTLVIMELMVNGDLKGYLRSHRPESEPQLQPPSLRRILQMAIEIADGMAYLAAKKFVHRDLAARNCMVAHDLTVKIGDFGMTRDIYETDYYRKGTKGLLPVRWMSPESLKDGIFSTNSDVFSYGIVLWEMATLASQPYQGLSNDQVLRYVIDGGVMERPENCPDKLYKMMCRTWQHRPSSRPTFLQIVRILLDDAAPNFRNLSFYHSNEGQELLTHPQHQQLIIDITTPLRVEEDDFSAQAREEGYLREEGAARSPLSSVIEYGRRKLTEGSNSINDHVIGNNGSGNKRHSNNSLTITTATSTQQQPSLIDFFRNAFGYGSASNNSSSSEPRDYHKLNSTSQLQQQLQQQTFLQQPQYELSSPAPSAVQPEARPAVQPTVQPQSQQQDQYCHHYSPPTPIASLLRNTEINENDKLIKKQMGNGFVVQKSLNTH